MICSELISKEKIPTGTPQCAALAAKFKANAVLPTDGRAARMIKLPFWKPPIFLSISSYPVGVPVR